MHASGANVTKNVPEMALKLTCNDRVKARFTQDGRQVKLSERLAIGGVSGAIAQVRVLARASEPMGREGPWRTQFGLTGFRRSAPP